MSPITVTFDIESWPQVLAALRTRLNYISERKVLTHSHSPLLSEVWGVRQQQVARAIVELEGAIHATN